MTRKEYEQRLETLEREIAALKLENVEDEPTPPHQRWKPKCGELYYFIDHDGETSCSSWNNTDWDYGRLHIGNVFHTEESAKYAGEYYTVLSEMREWAGNWNDLWKMSCDGCRVDTFKDILKNITYSEMRFATQEDAQNCIEAVGKDRLIKYYFGVRDHEIPAETE